MPNYIIDPVNDADYYTEVRDLLGITTDNLTDASLKSDILLGASERSVCKIYAPNWQSIMAGNDQIAADALRSCVIIRVAINILNMPTNQNLIQDQVRLIDTIITAKKISIDELKNNLEKIFGEQLSLIGVERSGGYPERTLVGKSGTINVFDYQIQTDGTLQKTVS